jgi:uncharacterized protein YjbI with pentapeptide repeats
MSPGAAGPAVPECVDMDEGTSDPAAEQQLLDAVAAGAICDFSDGAHITADEMARWGPERTIKATLLRRLLTAEDARYATDGIRLRGAVIEGVLDLEGVKVMNLELGQCRLTTAKASGATFTRSAWFGGAMFTGDARFDYATFTGGAGFNGATFTRDARFNDAMFTGYAGFGDTTFTGYAGFDSATFTGYAWFGGAMFTGGAGFNGATFTRDAWFGGAMFTGDAGFGGAMFTGRTRFISATFIGAARFNSATFTGDARFDDATFTGDAPFSEAIADGYDFRRAQFHSTDPGPWVAGVVNLANAVFHVRARVAITAAKSDWHRLQAREGVHVVLHGGVVDLEDAEFLRRSILSHSGSEPAVPGRKDFGERPEGFDILTPAEQARWTARDKASRLAKNLADELGPEKTTLTQVASLRRATAGDLVLSGVVLEGCAFAGAHGLDKLRIDATCSFQHPPAWPSRTWRLFTGRQVIFEEAQWRQEHTHGWALTSTTAASGKPNGPVPTALEIAGIYRDLRKGLEDAKDEPGAADFYYGEMEMRRLAARGRGHRDNANGGPTGRRPAWTERRLLDAYWAVSGYGLRAWRALTALTVLLLGCAALFTLPAFAHLPVIPQHVSSVDLRTGTLQYELGAQPGVKSDTTAAVTFGTALEFTARESLTLTRAAGTPLLQTTGVGTAVDIALRLLAPLLLGLALLAVRGRTKR